MPFHKLLKYSLCFFGKEFAPGFVMFSVCIIKNLLSHVRLFKHIKRLVFVFLDEIANSWNHIVTQKLSYRLDTQNVLKINAFFHFVFVQLKIAIVYLLEK